MDVPGRLEAFRLIDGGTLWHYLFPALFVAGLQIKKGVRAAAPFCFITASSRDVLFGEGEVLALDKNGQIQWQWRGEVQMLSAPTLTENQLVFTADSEHFIALDAVTGSEQVRMRLNIAASYHAPGWRHSLILIPGRGPDLLALNTAGEVQWHSQIGAGGWLDKTPVVAEESLVTVSSQGMVLALAVADGKLVWQQPVGPAGRPLSPPSTDGERIYVGARDGLYALAAADGRTLWHFRTERAVAAQPVIDGRFLYVTSHDHYFYLLDAQSGKVLWQHEMARRIELPAVVHKDVAARSATIFVADQGGKVSGFSQLLASPTPSKRKEVAPQQDVGQLLRLAQQFDAKGQSANAAKAYLQAGAKKAAAERFEEAEQWLAAVKVWHELSRPLKEAQALEGYAHSLEDSKAEESELVAVWKQAALTYEQEGERAKAEFCQRQVARYQQQPILDLSLAHEGLVLNAWAGLQLTVQNRGYGRASRITVHESGDQFEGEVASSQYYFRLNAGEEYLINLALRPLEYGNSVPLRLTIEYMDRLRVAHKMQKTIYLPVARQVADRVEGHMTNIFSAAVASGSITTKEVETWQDSTFELEREVVNKLVKAFSLDELSDLCFELDIDAEELANRQRKRDFAREIVLHLKRRNRLPALIQYCREVRSHLDW
jgi:outer membrane protein assembly factor BamB